MISIKDRHENDRQASIIDSIFTGMILLQNDYHLNPRSSYDRQMKIAHQKLKIVDFNLKIAKWRSSCKGSSTIDLY